MDRHNKRINTVLSHINSNTEKEISVCPTAAATAKKSPDDVVIVCAVRTPIGKAKRGNLKDTYPEELLATVLKGIVERTGINPNVVDDIAVGNVLPPGGGATIARMGMFYAGFPTTTSISTVNRQCSSGLQACASICSAIQAGYIKIGIGAGVESMSMGYGARAMASDMSSLSEKFPDAADCLIPMGITSENVATDFGITREEQDKMAFESHKKAANAQAKGHFTEIVPVHTTVTDDGKEKKVVVSQDEGVRAQTTLEGLAKLKPAFSADGSTTAGSSSQVSDGAAAVLLMKRSTAQQMKLPILARFVGFAVAGVPPRVMGIGPAFAIPKVLEQTGLKISDIDVFEINEAFASQAVYSIKKLGIDFAKVNPNGGAIAMGHPLGCTGARQIATLLPELKRRGARFGVTSMCIGSGMGAAAVIENESN